MSEKDPMTEKDRLERAVASLRQMSVPQQPPPSVTATTIQLLTCSSVTPDDVRRRERRKLMFRIAGFSGLAAAVVFVAIFFGSLLIIDRGASVAFGDVITKVKDAKSVVFNFKQKFGRQPEIEFTSYMQGDHIRMEIPNQLAIIADLKQKKVLQLDLHRKLATMQDMNKEARRFFMNPVDQLRQMKSKDAKKVGEVKLRGKTVQLYQAEQIRFFGTKGKGDMKIWVEPKTQLPVRIELLFNTQKGAKGKPYDTHFTLDNFGWNQAIPSEMFELEIPKGFTVKKKN